MSYHETPAIKTGRLIGVFRLNELIRDVEQNEGQHARFALRHLKAALGCKGDREGVLRYAREVLSAVKDW